MDIYSLDQLFIEDKLYTNAGIVTVYRAYLKSDPSQRFAIKELYFNNIKEANTFNQEACSMNSINHPRIITVRGVVFETEKGHHVSIITKFYPEGDLNREIMKRQRERQFWAEDELFKHFYELIEAHAFLESQNIAHRDIKPQNIFLDGSDMIVADLGCASSVEATISRSMVGTPLYLCPIKRQQYINSQLGRNNDFLNYNVFKSDVYSLGLVFLYMAGLQDLLDLSVLNNLEQKLNQRIQSLTLYPRL